VKRVTLNILVGTLAYCLSCALPPSAGANERAPVAKAEQTDTRVVAGKQAPAVSPSAAIVEKIITVEGITEYLLPNGMKILLMPDQSKETVSVDITYLVGARHEMYDEVGSATLLQRLLFKGTVKYPAIDQELGRRGVRFTSAAEQNHTHFSALFPARDEDLEWVLRMDADRMVNTRIAEQDLGAEMALMRGVYESSDTKRDAPFFLHIQKMEYAWNSYGAAANNKRIASAKTQIDSLRAFYRIYYQPDNAILLVAGKFDETKVLGWIADYFGAVPKPARELPKPQTQLDFKVPDGARGNGVSSRVVTASYRMPSALHPDAAALRFSFYVMTRLRELSIKNRGGSYGGTEMFSRDSGLQVFGVNGVHTAKSSQQTEADLKEIYKQVGDRLQSVDEDKKRAADKYSASEKERAIELARAELLKMAQELTPTADEMARARQHFASEAERTLDNHEKLGARLADYIALGDWRLFFHSRDRAETMTAEEVSAAAAKYYRSDNQVFEMVRVKDSGSRVDTVAGPTAVEVLKNFKGKPTRLIAVEAPDADTLTIDQRTKKLQIGGLAVSLLAKKTNGGAVAFNIRLRSGDEKSLFGKAAIAEVTGRMLDRGSRKFQYGPIDEKSKLQLRGDVSAGTANFQTTRPYIAAAIGLAAQVMREPTFPEAAGKTVVAKMLEGINFDKRNPMKVATNAMQRHFNIFPPGDMRYARSFEEQEEAIGAIKASDLREFHKQFYGAVKGEVVVIGDFDEAEVTAALREAFSDWNTGMPYARLARPHKDVAPINRTINMPGSESAFFAARLNVNMQDTDPDYAALLVADYIFGGAPGFESRLTSRIRVRDGASYAVRSVLSVGSTDRGGMWNVHAFADAPNIAKVEKALLEELAEVNRNGFTANEITAAKSALLLQRRAQRMRDNVLANGHISNAALTGQMMDNSYLGRTFAWSEQLEAKIAALKIEEVNTAFRKHIHANKLSIIKAGDFKKTAP
jgi:zinc protease